MLWGGVLCKTVKPLKAVFFNALLFSFLLLSTAFISCAGGAGSPKGSDSGETSLSVRLPGSKALYDKDDIVTFTVTISSGSYSNTKTAGKGETMTFSNIPAGTYTVTAYGKVADGSVAAKCVTSVQIIAGENTSTTIRLQRLDYYVVTFRNEDVSVISQQNVTTGYTVPKPAAPTKTGYNFSGWRTSATATTSFDFNTAITADTDLIATFGIKTYKITFNYNGGTVGTATSTTVDTDYNTSPTVPSTTPARNAPDGSSYTFMGWNETSDATTILAGLEAATADKTYYAIWSPKVKVTFDYNGGTYSGSNKKEVYPNKDTAPTVPASTEEPSKTGYKFKGWASSSSATTADNTVSTTPVGADTTYYAVWIPAYTITYSSTPAVDTTGTEFSGKLSYTSDEGLSSLPAPSKTGLTFDGWYTDAAFTPANKVTSIAEGTTGNTTLYAKWKVTVTFDYNGGKVGSSTSSEDDYDYASTFSSIKPSTNPTKSHATFKHWSTVSDGTGTAVSGTASVTTSTTYYAIWDSTEINYESPVTLNTNFTSETGSYRSYTAGTAYTLPEPTAAEQTALKLTFAGWYEDEDFTPAKKVTSIPATATGDKTFYAKWTATVTILEYKATTAVPNPPAIGTAQTVVYGKKATRPSPNPTTSRASEGYSDFLGWQTDGTTDPVDFDFSTDVITKNTVIFGKWKSDFDFVGTTSEFLAKSFDTSRTTPYKVKITSASNSDISTIAEAIGLSSSSYYKAVKIDLDLSECGATVIPNSAFGALATDFSARLDVCANLTGIKLPNTLLKIEAGVFNGTYGITELEIPAGTTEIFSLPIRNITSLNIPSSVKKFGTGVLMGLNLTEFNVEGVNSWRRIDGGFTSTNGTLIQSNFVLTKETCSGSDLMWDILERD